jgi:hypothetical protein
LFISLFLSANKITRFLFLFQFQLRSLAEFFFVARSKASIFIVAEHFRFGSFLYFRSKGKKILKAPGLSFENNNAVGEIDG